MHTPKCAGTTLVKHVLKNYQKDEILWLSYEKLNLDPFNTENKDCYQEVKEYFLNYDEAGKSRLKVIFGHLAPYGIHKFFDKKVRYITFLRNPYQRVISFYNYNRMLYENEDKRGKKKRMYKYSLLINGKVPSFTNWLEERYLQKSANKPFSILSIYEYLQTQRFINKNLSKKKMLKELFDKFYFVGITEKFEEDSLYFYQMLGINKFFTDQNISKKYVRNKYSQILKESYSKAFEMDEIVYNEALEFNLKFKKVHKEFFLKAQKLKRKRKILLPFTQLIFDFPRTLSYISWFLRKRSAFYSRFRDYFKKKFNFYPNRMDE